MEQVAERTVGDGPAATAELGGYRFSALRGGDYALYRGEHPSTVSALLLVPKTETPASSKRLEHELSLQADLDSAWAVPPVRLARYEERAALVLQDPGGEPLDRIVGQPLDTTRFLRIAIAVAEALRRAHERGLIHRDVKPANVLVDPDGRRAWLTGFGIASRLPREHQAPEPPDVIAGTLAYMAPEQTGRMNRATDSRSDLYALGVTLYELLTGSLPFTTLDPIELIHSHIAREPAPPTSHPRGAPDQVAAIVMKLLAKTPEDRYQTAAGLKADLAACLAALERTGRIDPFPLAASDAPDRLLIPERLYGRERQIATLLDAFDHVASDGEPHLVLVSGYSGIGKSSVVNELHKVIVLPRGIFISGKFDQRLQDVPYSTVAQAFQGLILQILKSNEAEIARWRDAVLEAVGASGRLLTDLIPELVRMIGPQPPVPDLAPFDAQVRIQTVFQRFVGVFARAEHPLLIFIDDLQWLDPATLALIEQLATNPETRHLLLIGAYRDNEVGPDHLLMRTISAIRQAGVPVAELALGPISPADVTHLVADALRCPPTRARRLAGLVYRKTGGNPFFCVQFLTNLAEEGLVRLDAGQKAWTWDLEGIDAKGFTDNLVDLMVGRLRRLPPDSQDALKLLACLGAGADAATLQLVLDASEPEINERLAAAVRSGTVVSRAGAYRFLHDRVQEAAYALIPESLRAALHYRVGHRLLGELTQAEVGERIFDIVNQLNLGVLPGVDPHEKARVARLDLQAGLKAKASTAYASACRYFAAGLTHLGEDGWRRAYDLAFKLLLEQAECELLRGELATSAALIEEVLARGQSKTDRTAGFRLRITLQLLAGEMSLAVRTALECLKMFDMTFPERPTAEDVRHEYEDLQRRIGSRTIESLVDLPLMEDPEIRAVSAILLTLGLTSYFVDEQLYDMLAFRMVKLSIDYGHSESCTVGYGGAGIILGPAFNRYEDGERFTRASVELCERHGYLPEKTGSYVLLQMARLWTRPIGEALECLDAANRAAAVSGEVVYACYSAEHRITNLLARGDPLDEVWPEAGKALTFAQEKRYVHIIDILSAIRDFIATLRAASPGDAPSADEATLLRTGIPVVACFYWILQLQLRFLLGDPAAALAAADKAEPLIWSARCHIQTGTYRFYRALALAAVIRASPTRRRTVRQKLTAAIAALHRLTQHAPHTYEHKHDLAAAELAGLEGRDLEAMRLYERAVRSAANKGFLQEAALGAELAADFFDGRGLDNIAHSYRLEARNGYIRWGALAKVAEFDRRHPEIAPAAPQTGLPTIESPLEHLDLATVTRMSQAVAGEMLLDRLIKTLMTITMEHAGADRGLLLLPTGEELRVEAEATSTADTINVVLLDAESKAPDLPASILAHVCSRQDAVLLDDARVKNAFSADKYLRQARARSMLCVPMVKQGVLTGVLYLENSLASHVFTPAKMAVLTLLSSQVAISLQNARLYTDLVTENRERQKAEEALREAQAELSRVIRLTTIGEMASSIAHEINQPLTAVGANGRAALNWLGRETPNLDEARKALGRIARDVGHAGDVMQSLRALVTKSDPKRDWVEIDEVIRQVLALARGELQKHRVTLRTQLSDETPRIRGDQVQLQQVLLNLVMNGAEAMNGAAGPHVLTITSGLGPDGDVRVAVADTGVGMDEATAQHVFDSFFTTKASGMGMGLSICRSIIGAHGGRIWVQANAPQGAIFEFTLPVGGVAP